MGEWSDLFDPWGISEYVDMCVLVYRVGMWPRVWWEMSYGLPTHLVYGVFVSSLYFHVQFSEFSR